MHIEIGDLITQGLDLYRDNGDLVGTIYADGEFWAAVRPDIENGKPSIILYTQDLENIIYIINNFKSIYHDTAKPTEPSTRWQ